MYFQNLLSGNNIAPNRWQLSPVRELHHICAQSHISSWWSNQCPGLSLLAPATISLMPADFSCAIRCYCTALLSLQSIGRTCSRASEKVESWEYPYFTMWYILLRSLARSLAPCPVPQKLLESASVPQLPTGPSYWSPKLKYCNPPKKMARTYWQLRVCCRLSSVPSVQ